LPEELVYFVVGPGCPKNQIPVVWQWDFHFDAPKGLRPPAQGCRFGYPGNSWEKRFQPHRGCVVFSERNAQADTTALRLRTRSLSLPRVAEAATLGWRPLPLWGINKNLSRTYRWGINKNLSRTYRWGINKNLSRTYRWGINKNLSQ
jgi:hypothetical protein